MLCCPVQYLDGVQGRVLHPLSLLPRLGRLVRPAQALSPLQISQSESIGKNQLIRNYNLHAWCNINKLAEYKFYNNISVITINQLVKISTVKHYFIFKIFIRYNHFILKMGGNQLARPSWSSFIHLNMIAYNANCLNVRSKSLKS